MVGGAEPIPDARVDAIEAWFVVRGLPHFVERQQKATAIWARALPLLVVAYLLRSLSVLKLTGDAWTLGENLLAAVFGLFVALATWVVANLLRGRRPFERPRSIGVAELAVFILGPAIPAVLFGQWSDGLEAVLIGMAVLAALWVITSYGVPSLLRWAWDRTIKQLPLLFNVIVRALPLLLLFTTFLFINAEVWQVAGTLHGLAYGLVLGIFFVLGALFLLSRMPGLMRELNHFESWAEIEELVVGTPAEGLLSGVELTEPPGEDRPRPRQRFNIGLVTLFSQGIQITFVAVLLTAYFVLFGVLAIPEATIQGWTTLDNVHVLATFTLGGRDLVLAEPLIRVAAFLGAFTGMYFTVQLSTDATYREDFTEDVAPLLRQALGVRRIYDRRGAGTSRKQS